MLEKLDICLQIFFNEKDFKNPLIHSLYHIKKLTKKWVTDINIKPKTIQLSGKTQEKIFVSSA